MKDYQQIVECELESQGLEAMCFCSGTHLGRAIIVQIYKEVLG